METIVIYSGGSNTTAVAGYIASKMNCKAVTVQEAAGIDLNECGRIIVGTRVRAGKVPADLADFVSKNKSVIDQKSPAFFLCCMYNGEKGQKQVDKIAGELGFSKYVYFNKGKKIVQQPGNPIDSFIGLL